MTPWRPSAGLVMAGILGVLGGCGDGSDVGSAGDSAPTYASSSDADPATAGDDTAGSYGADAPDGAAGPAAGDTGVAAGPDDAHDASATSVDTPAVDDVPAADGTISDVSSDRVGSPEVELGEDVAPSPDAVPDVSHDDVPGADAAEPADATTVDATTVDAMTVDTGTADTGPPDATSTDAVVWDSPIGQTCFAEIYDPAVNGPDYDQFAPTIAEHCLGTNHQDITGVEKVVILGDSVAQGTPNDIHPLSTDNSHFWRNLFAEWAAPHFGLDQGDDLGIEWGLWKAYDYLSGKGTLQHAGDFSNCAKWGARTDDFLAGGGQIGECFPDGGSDKNTLIVFTMGGNDIAKITQVGGEASAEEVAAGYPEAWALAESTVTFLAEALYYLKDPANFPNGSHVIFANPFEFTDGTGLVDACSPQTITVPFVGELDVSDLGINMAGLAGFASWEQPEVQEAIVIWILEQYMKLAVETQTDMVWMLEHFCGHGYVATGPDADEDNRCYRGPDAELYFDLTCIHPSDAGHAAIYEMFKASVLE